MLTLSALGQNTLESGVYYIQCVKYKCILDAEDKVYAKRANNAAILVIGGELSPENKKVQDTLGITVFEKVDYRNN